MRARSILRGQDADAAIDRVLQLVLTWRERPPAPQLPKRLDALFRELSRLEPRRPAEEIEDLIWALWGSHPESHACSDMAVAVEAMAADAFDLARPILDELVVRHPDWAEAWNKRAIIAFANRRERECLADIEQTLRLEPRHFGAMAGFAQICARQGRLREACAAFETALDVNPHLEGVADVVHELRLPRSRLH
jgi:tetratricopeptide (TPR) repeat protein